MDCDGCPGDSFVTRLVADVSPQSEEAKWLVEGLWPTNGVGILGGAAKTTKTWFSAELSMAIAAGVPALGHFAARGQGSVLFYGAEDSLPAMRTRFEGIALARNLVLNDLPIHLLDVPSMQLNKQADATKLRNCIEALRPTMLVLDPFVRVTSIDENSSAEVSAVLGFFRDLQRKYSVSILVTHHARKSASANPNHALRGSSDFAAWSDVNLYLSRSGDLLTLNIQHRSARTPDPVKLRLNEDPAPHLVIQNNGEPDFESRNSLGNEILQQLSNSQRLLTTLELRERLRKRKSDVVQALEQLRSDEKISRNLDAILDDRKAVKVARQMGINHTGTLNIIRKAYQRNLIKSRDELRTLLNELKTKDNFFLSNGLLKWMLKAQKEH